MNPITPTLLLPPVSDTLERLHRAAKGDWKHRVSIAPLWILSRVTGRNFIPKSTHTSRKTFSSVTAPEGRFLYLLARAMHAKRIVEFGCSFGISTIYLAAAAHENGGSVITTEIEPTKVSRALENLRYAGLDSLTTILEGDALQTLLNVDGSIDLLFLDGMKHLYLPVIELLRKRLSSGAVVIADNVNMPSANPYVDFVNQAGGGFTSSTLFGGRMLMSLYAGQNATGHP